jgi:hypothetical protein
LEFNPNENSSLAFHQPKYPGKNIDFPVDLRFIGAKIPKPFKIMRRKGSKKNSRSKIFMPIDHQETKFFGHFKGSLDSNILH